MLLRRGICRPSQSEIEELEHFRQLVKEAREVLARFPAPDTFLGRKTQQPFPKDSETIRESRWREYPS